MDQYEVEVSAVIPAPPERVYALLADYRNGHPSILPEEYFRGLEVEHGGYGNGTIVQFDMLAMGARRRFRALITEPEPGRVLAESYPDTGGFTTFTIDPLAAGGSRVTICTVVAHRRPGLGGSIERWFARRFLRKVYRRELALLAERLAGRT